MNQTTTTKQPLLVSFIEKQLLVEVRCDKGHLVAKASPKAVVEVSCTRCRKLVTVKAQ